MTETKPGEQSIRRAGRPGGSSRTDERSTPLPGK
jgi:hypothetical protein